jgi:hypothetical protein
VNTRSIQANATKLAWTYFVVVMTSYAVVLLSARMPPPFVDYPDWVYQGMLLHLSLTGHPVAGYALKQYPVPNSTTIVALGLLDGLLPWQWAAKVWICFYLGLSSLASWILARALSVDWKVIVVLPGLIFLNINFWFGAVNFELGMCLLLVLVAMLLRNQSTWWIAGWLSLMFFTHM